MYFDASDYACVIFSDGTTVADILGIEEHATHVMEWCCGGSSDVSIRLRITWLCKDGTIETRVVGHRDVRLIRK